MKIIVMKNVLILFLTACISGLFTGCGTKSDQKSEATDTGTSSDLAEVQKVVEQEFKYPIPTAYQVTQLLQDADAAFVLNITNSVDNVDKYETQRDKALNLGIYGADLSYASTYNKQEETRQFLNVSKRLLDELDISNVFDESVITRVDNNIDNKDSLITIVTQSFFKTYQELNKAGQSKLSFLVVAGSWIEALYITCQLSISSEYDKDLMDIIAKQKTSASRLTELAEEYQDDADIASILPLLRFMNLTYGGVNESVALTEGQLNDILNNVELTRNEIIE